jgi:Uma2 family endonuclease
MALVDVSEHRPFVRGHLRYVRAPNPIEFPSEEPWEEHVSETKRHLEVRTTLYLLLKDAFAGVAIGSDQFVYSDAGDPKKCLSPDVFVKLGAREELFDSWKVWERGAPDLAVEIVSASDHRDAEWSDKLERYQASGISEVVRFDPADRAQPIRVWDRVDGELLERSPESTHLRECLALQLWWVVVPSAYGPMLRLARDRGGAELLPTPSEERMRLAAELAEERKARAAAEHERMLSEHARKEAERKQQQAERERQLAEQKLREERDAHAREREAAQAELERLRAELARARGEGR